MSDRFGPSVDCEECGRTFSFGELFTCDHCEGSFCRDCVKEHEWKCVEENENGTNA